MRQESGHRALRIGRHSQCGNVYLVTFTTVLRRRIFLDFDLARTACRTFSPSAASATATLLCWVLMPDHFHALIRLDGVVTLSRVVQRLKSMSARACHDLQPELATWSRAFHDHALRRDDDILHTARYIVANPVRAGLVGCAGEYPFWDAVWV